MAKSTIEALEKVIKKILQPMDTKISSIMDQIKKIDEKICNLEMKSSTTCQSCNCDKLKAPENSQLNGSTTSNTQGKNTVHPVNRRSTTTNAAQNPRRGSLPASSGRQAPPAPAAPPQPPPSRPAPTAQPPAAPAAQSAAPESDSLVDGYPQQNNHDDTQGEWQTVGPPRRRRKSQKPSQRITITGTGPEDISVQTTIKRSMLHACFFKPSTSEEAIKSYMSKRSNCDGSDFIVKKLNLKHQYYSSFAISVPSSKFELFMSAENWPPGTVISEWFRRSGGRARSPRAPAAAADNATGPTTAPGAALAAAAVASRRAPEQQQHAIHTDLSG